MTSSALDRAVGVIGDFAYKAPCRVVATTPVVATGTQTIDGVALAVLDRVLVTAQADTTKNGIYTVDTGAWELAPDFLSSQSVARGTQCFITDGSVNAHTVWYIVATNPVNPQTPSSPSAITVSKLSTGGSTTPGGSANQLQYNAAGSFGGFTMSGDATIVVATGVITVTKTGGVAFATSATTDATNASNIASGTLAAARLPATAVQTNVDAQFTVRVAGATGKSLTDAATVAWDMSLGNEFVLLATNAVGNTRTIGAPSNVKDGDAGFVYFVQDATGSRVFVAGSGNNHLWAGGSQATGSSTNGAIDKYAYAVKGTKILWDLIGKAYA